MIAFDRENGIIYADTFLTYLCGFFCYRNGRVFPYSCKPLDVYY